MTAEFNTIVTVIASIVVLATAIVGYFKVRLPIIQNEKTIHEHQEMISHLKMTLDLYKDRLTLVEHELLQEKAKVLILEERCNECLIERDRLRELLLKVRK